MRTPAPLRGPAIALVLLGAVLAANAGASAGVSPARSSAAAGPREYGCPILPAGNPINQEIAHAPVSPRSAEYVASIGLGAHLHPDFGTEPGYGIPYAVAGPRAGARAGHLHRIRL